MAATAQRNAPVETCMNSSSQADRPYTIAILALGGQGGGVLTGWLVDTAERNGFLAQSTYVAGVAQRTGATVYCVELYPGDKVDKDGRVPVFTPYPVPGDVDLVVTGEMAETGRAIQKGFVTPNCTTLISSSHRVYSITEKEALDDGILDQSPVADAAAKAASRFVCFDMEAAAEQTGSIISAIMLGSIAATEALPFSREDYEQTIRDTGRAVEKNLSGFAAGFSQASSATDYSVNYEVAEPKPEGENGRQLAARIAKTLPSSVGTIALHGALRCLDYQDREHADDYLDLLGATVQREKQAGGDSKGYAVSSEVARQMALQLCYEDIARVAELKTRESRSSRVRSQIGATGEQPVRVVEYFHPRIEEFCDGLPAGVGRWLLNSGAARSVLRPLFSKGRNIRTSTISGYLLLRMFAKQKSWRRKSYRYQTQRALIDQWLAKVHEVLASDHEAAVDVAASIESVRGYGDTWDRGYERYRTKIGQDAKVTV